jgi:hypothetical protein
MYGRTWFHQDNINFELFPREEEACVDDCRKCGICGYKEQLHDEHDKKIDIHWLYCENSNVNDMLDYEYSNVFTTNFPLEVHTEAFEDQLGINEDIFHCTCRLICQRNISATQYLCIGHSLSEK